MITNSNYNVDLASLQVNKLMYDFAKEMNFDLKAVGKKYTRDGTLLNLLESPAITASGISNKIILASNPNEISNRKNHYYKRNKLEIDLTILIKKLLLLLIFH